MDIYLLGLNFIVADKLMGGMPSKLIEHIVINNVSALTWWSATKILYGAGYLAMLPFTFTKENNSNNEPYTLVDTAFYNEYVIEQRDIFPVSVIAQNTDQNPEQTTDQLPHQCVLPVHLSSDWEIVDKDDSKIILTNNKKGKEIIITKKEIDDMVVITKE